jgi:uncharacterized OB-fold protein
MSDEPKADTADPDTADPDTADPDGMDWTSGAARVATSSCDRCGHRWYIRRERCPRCSGGRISRVTSAPTGRVVAVTSVSPGITAAGVGVSLALVDLDDGIGVLARCAPELAPGERVRWYVPEPDPAGRPSVPHVPHVKAVGE